MPKPALLSPWQQFEREWQNCVQYSLCETRRSVVLCKGSLPCDVLFIGEAPGPSEDRSGIPFDGPAGALLHNQIEAAMANTGLSEVRMCFTNLVCCIPVDVDNSKKWGEPPKSAIEACTSRFVQFVYLARPRLVVLVGDLAKEQIAGQADLSKETDGSLPWCAWCEPLMFTEITHPARILRLRNEIPAQASLLNSRAIIYLENAFREL